MVYINQFRLSLSQSLPFIQGEKRYKILHAHVRWSYLDTSVRESGVEKAQGRPENVECKSGKERGDETLERRPSDEVEEGVNKLIWKILENS